MEEHRQSLIERLARAGVELALASQRLRGAMKQRKRTGVGFERRNA